MKMHLKKKKKSNFLYYIIITILIYLFIDKNFKNIEFKNSNEDFVNQVLQGSNYHLVTSKNDITISVVPLAIIFPPLYNSKLTPLIAFLVSLSILYTFN